MAEGEEPVSKGPGCALTSGLASRYPGAPDHLGNWGPLPLFVSQGWMELWCACPQGEPWAGLGRGKELRVGKKGWPVGRCYRWAWVPGWALLAGGCLTVG